MISFVNKYCYRSCLSYFIKLKQKVDLDTLAKEVEQQKIIINSPQTKNIDDFLKKYNKMKNIQKDYELMQTAHKDYPSLAQYQMSRTLDMEKTARRIGQVHKSQKNNLENMNKSTKAIQILKNELYELYFLLENKKYDLNSQKQTSLLKLKKYVENHNLSAIQMPHQDVINSNIPLLAQSGEMLVDIQGQLKAFRPDDSRLLQQFQYLKKFTVQIFNNQGFQIFDNSFYNFQKCEYPINMIFNEEYKFVETNAEEKEYFCLDSSIPGLLQLIQTRINFQEKFKILVFTLVYNKNLNGMQDLKIEVISETDAQNLEEDIISLIDAGLSYLEKTINFKNIKIESINDNTKSQITLQMQDGDLLKLRSYGNFISKRLNLKLKHFAGQEEFEEVSCINILEIPSLLNLLLYQNHAQQQNQ
ncbi:hypothetical protein TTHERM_01119490 (macronuclear) [Tetrahymena thermophila SB210]|uniref:Uncharacterized protein n=1 Tax=Tetrahymena thermophila (strain SB210) TaxID=312017 RepID=Q239N1_TETTS|nr:hypothetical protein TTHERM_01119490 [Tetrahymena thermophila SB210]EAR93239.2 hypothetical protein TTHERM_01119490 [Tetrahymena thermophila SB210]|eukprot:XP_001013484.2 hypothetical protein TTHERM_01119490 [Tetrahymena thermophila SB210]